MNGRRIYELLDAAVDEVPVGDNDEGADAISLIAEAMGETGYTPTPRFNAGFTRDEIELYSDRRWLGEVGVDSGHVQVGDCGRVDVKCPTTRGDGSFPVFDCTVNGRRRLVVFLD